MQIMKEKDNINIDQLYNQIDHLLENADKYEETNSDIEQDLRNSVITIRMLMKELGISPYRKYWILMKSGYSLLPDQFICPECNYIVKDPDILPKFCSNCGERLFKRPGDIRYISKDRNINITDVALEEAIKRAEEAAEEQKEIYKLCPISESEIHCDGTKDCMALKNGKNKGCQKSVKYQYQLAEWLKELKQLRADKLHLT